MMNFILLVDLLYVVLVTGYIVMCLLLWIGMWILLCLYVFFCWFFLGEELFVFLGGCLLVLFC